MASPAEGKGRRCPVNEKGASRSGGAFLLLKASLVSLRSDLDHILSLRALRTIRDLELYFLALY